MATIAPTETTALLREANLSNIERTLSHSSGRLRYTSISNTSADLDAEGKDFETTYRNESKLLFKYSAPLIITYLIQYSYNLVTVFVAGRLGTDELGAASLASMTANITGLCVYEGLAMSLDTLTSQAYGGGKKKLVGLHVQRMSALMLVSTIPIGAIWICSPWMIEKIVPEKEVARLAGTFLRYYLLGAPGYGIFEAAKRFTQAQGNFNASLIPVLICAPLNVLWNWLFAFKLGLGFAGAALAVSLSNTLQPIVFFIYINIFAQESLECWPEFSIRRSFQNWGQMINLAVPGILMVLSEWLAFDILTFTSSHISKEALAAQSVLMTVAVLVYHIPMPTAIAASTRFGNLIGHGALMAARKALKFFYVVFLGIGVLDIILLTVLRSAIASAFTTDVAVRNLIVEIMPLVAAAQLADSMSCIANALLRGLGRQKIGGWVNLGVYYIWAIPLAVFLAFGTPKLELMGLWIGPLSGLGIVFIVVSIYLKRADWQKAVDDARARGE